MNGLTPTDLRALSGFLTVVETRYVATQNAAFQIAKPDPSRVLLWAGTYIAGGTFNISTLANVTATTGIAVTSPPLGFTMTLESHPGLIAQPWYVFSPNGNANITVIEVFFRDT